LKPVDQGTAQKLHEPTNYGLRMQRFFAKRYLLATIDFSLLAQDGARFTITPFEDARITLRALKLAGSSSSGQLREWVGSLDGVGPMIGRTPEGNAVERAIPPVTLWVRTGDHDVSLKIAREVAADRGNQPSFQPLPPQATEPTAPAPAVKLHLQTLSGEWFIPTSGKYVAIRPVEDDPRYHIVYEVDNDKVVRSAHGGEEARKKLQAIEEFRQQLELERSREAASSNDK
jgi:hypothetical protein